MFEAFALIGLILSLAALLVGAEYIRRLNVQHAAIRGLNERLLANEIRVVEQEQSIGQNMKSIERLKERNVIHNARMVEHGQLLDQSLKAIERLNERLLAGEMRAAEQERLQDQNVNILQQLERQAKETRNTPAAPMAGTADAGDGKSVAKG